MKAHAIEYLVVALGYLKQMFPYSAAQWTAAVGFALISWYLPRTKNVLANSVLEGVGNVLKKTPGAGPLIAELIGTKPPAPPLMTTTTTVEIIPDPLPPQPPVKGTINDAKK